MTARSDEKTPVTATDNGRGAAGRPVIVIRDMTKVYRMGEYEVRALNGVSVDILAGEFVAIMGPSGSGKSTMMNMLGALDKPTGGQYLLDGIDVSALSDNELADIRNRTNDESENAVLAAQLLADNKNRLENRLVHADILTRLEGLAERASLSPARILKLRRLQHLRRDIQARLKPGVYDDQLLATLHPTPAVGGTPRRKALAYIRDHEPFCRGWYAGACGLISEDVAEFAVAIRSVLLTADALRLYAGAGIVAGSEPEAEWQELDDKLANLLSLLSQGSRP